MLPVREVIKAACLAPTAGIPLETVRGLIDQEGLQVRGVMFDEQ